MLTLDANQWNIVNNLIYHIYADIDETDMRRRFLEQLAAVIDIDAADFFLSGKVFGDGACGKEDRESEVRDSLVLPVYYKTRGNLSAECDDIDYSRGIVYGGKAIVYRDSDIMRDEERVETPYFRKVYAPNHWHYSLQMVLASGGQFLGAATFYRKDGTPDFTWDDAMLVDGLKDHLSLRLSRDAEELRREQQELCQEKPSVHEAAQLFDLTHREETVLRKLMDGCETDEICAQLSITGNTLKKHIQNLYRKIGVSDRVGLFKTIRERE